MSALPSTPIRSSPAQIALCRSALWEAFALGFRPPTSETIARLASQEGAAALGTGKASAQAAEVMGKLLSPQRPASTPWPG